MTRKAECSAITFRARRSSYKKSKTRAVGSHHQKTAATSDKKVNHFLICQNNALRARKFSKNYQNLQNIARNIIIITQENLKRIENQRLMSLQYYWSHWECTLARRLDVSRGYPRRECCQISDACSSRSCTSA